MLGSFLLEPSLFLFFFAAWSIGIVWFGSLPCSLVDAVGPDGVDEHRVLGLKLLPPLGGPGVLLRRHLLQLLELVRLLGIWNR